MTTSPDSDLVQRIAQEIYGSVGPVFSMADAVECAQDILSGPLSTLSAERDAARAQVSSYERSFDLEREWWRTDDIFESLRNLRVSLAGANPAAAELIARTESRLAQAGIGLPTGRSVLRTIETQQWDGLLDRLRRVSAADGPQAVAGALSEARIEIARLVGHLATTTERLSQATNRYKHAEKAYGIAMDRLDRIGAEDED